MIEDMKAKITAQMKAQMALMETKIEKMLTKSLKGKEVVVEEENEDDNNVLNLICIFFQL